ncbi:MAG: PH domain-containing protein [Bauldia sp.]|nr:MAG: PH domain-containing protein [Bauldia sp.]
MALNLGPGEEVVFEGHPSWRAILGFYIKGILVVAVVAALVALIGGGSDVALVTVIAVAGAVLVVVIGFVRRVATRYTITTRRLNIKHGIVSRDVQETKIERVQDVNYSQSVFQRIMQIGDVDFDTAADNPESDFVFAGVANPEEVVERVTWRPSPAPGLRGAPRSPRPASIPASRPGRQRLAQAEAATPSPSPAAARSSSTRSVRSQVKLLSSRPKWP